MPKIYNRGTWNSQANEISMFQSKFFFLINGNTQTFLRWYVFLAHLCWQWIKLCRRTSWSPWWAVSCLHLSVVSSLLHFKSPTDTSIHHRLLGPPLAFMGRGSYRESLLFHNLCSWSKNISWNLSVFFSKLNSNENNWLRNWCLHLHQCTVAKKVDA